MSDLKLVVRTADRTRKAEINISSEQYVSDIIQAAISNWALPSDTDYSIVNVSTGKVLNQSQKLQKVEISDGDVLEVQPLLVAGEE